METGCNRISKTYSTALMMVALAAIDTHPDEFRGLSQEDALKKFWEGYAEWRKAKL